VEKFLGVCQTNSPQARIADSSSKGRQPFIRTHKEALSVVAMCVGNPNRPPVRINA
jgi:hypothetical protein